MRKINYRLYFFELFFAVLVVFVHASFKSGDFYFDSLGRGTVIFFFILSSYFYNKTLAKSDYSYKKDTLFRCLRLLIISIVTFAIYCAIFIPINISKFGSYPTSFINFFNVYKPKTSFLWFTIALILCYLIFPFIYKIKWIHESKYMIIIPSVILISVYVFRLIAGIYDFGVFSDPHVTRNFIFTGLPCFLLGTYFYDHEKNIKNIPTLLFIILVVLLFISGSLEAYMHLHLHSKVNEFYLSSILLASICFIYSIKNPEFILGERLYSLFGRSGPLFLYLSHRLFMQLIYSYLNVAYVNYIVIPISIICPLIIALIYNFFRNRKKIG